ncbi:MAG: prolipoprotein diacylglyceryl transferase [Treponema sp.]|uniref:prolipoprotein diacylglyceryl transferase family protein n=1 Tax=Treponema sp. TaxID=166 RepID=UPI00345A67BE|nr:prolipoprotein diacylglyceryl transferase [Treponema sp.]
MFSRKKDVVLSLYPGSCGTLRFFCEFLRGDESRGFIGQFSVSAWISLIIFVVTFIACFVTFFTQLSKNRVS